MVINFEIEVIRRAFQALGLSIEVNNPHPDPEMSEERFQHLLAHRLKMQEQNNTFVEVHLEANHCPWGG